MPQTDAPVTTPSGGARLRWWTELPLIVVVYAAYMGGRLLARGDVPGAVGHGLTILDLERRFHLDAEHPLNRLFTAHAWIGVPADFWYASLHYVVTPAVLVWLFRSRTVHYRAARAWLMTSTMIGLIGFTLLPTCPPRLLAPVHGFVDTMAQYSSYGWWGGAASAPRGLGGMTNQYAAMPSLHVGWALWCGIMLWRHGRSRTARVVAVAYPLLTAVVVMGTANHYFLDAAAGVAVMGAGYLLSRPVLRIAGVLRERFAGRARVRPATAGAPSAAGAAASSTVPAADGAAAPSGAKGSAIVGAECQTSAGERIPRQRGQRAEPRSGASDAGGGTPASAR
ncbi:phosphatase PAP2 family protein [Streptomyces sp. NPDC002004]